MIFVGIKASACCSKNAQIKPYSDKESSLSYPLFYMALWDCSTYVRIIMAASFVYDNSFIENP